MNADSLRYLAENTDITYLSEGSTARSIVESSNLEIARVREFMVSTYSNVFINTAQGVYLDLIGDMLGVPRGQTDVATVAAEDKNIKLEVFTGTLRDKFPNLSDQSLGQIPSGFYVKTADSSIKFKTTQETNFPGSATEVYLTAIADEPGRAFNVGKGRLVSHDGPSGVSSTNLHSISNGSENETDKNYRYRLSNSIAGSATANESAIRLVITGIPDVSRVIFNEYARGAGTYDVMLVPVGNKVSARANSLAQLSIDSVSAFGISGKVIEPDYVEFKISINLIPATATGQGAVDAAKISANTAVIDYFESIPLGGEFIVNQLRALVVGKVKPAIKDIRIIDICFNGRPRPIRNFRLKNNQLFTPATDSGIPAVIIL